MLIDTRLADRLYAQANAERWRVSKGRFAAALETGAQRAFASGEKSPRHLEQYLTALHLEDLALACACADGDEQAWDHFMMEQRPLLYRAADALEWRGAGGAEERY